MHQYQFAFIKEMDRQLAAEREARAEKDREGIKDSWLHSMVKNYPPTPDEWGIITMGIRLARHVHDNECERCKLATYNHCPDSLDRHYDPERKQYLVTKVCLKDYIKWCVQHRLKDLAKEALRYE